VCAQGGNTLSIWSLPTAAPLRTLSDTSWTFTTLLPHRRACAIAYATSSNTFVILPS
jgi:hypothetical protein